MATAESYLKPPRLPRKAPVVVLHLRADNDPSGNTRRAFVVLATSGRTVEVIDEGSAGERVIWARWPWYSHTFAQKLGIECAYAVPIYVGASEYKRWRNFDLDADSLDAMPDVAKLRKLGDRCARYAAVREALVSVRRSTSEHEWREYRAQLEGRENLYGDTRDAVIYHRHPDDGGDDASDHLRRAMAAFVAAGMVERTDEPAEDAQPFFTRSVGNYRATDSTPDLY